MEIDYLSWVERNWGLLARVAGGHAGIYRATNGLVGHRFPGSPSMLLLDHVGAKSGTLRTSPLVYARDGVDFVLVASKGGYPKSPGWFHNLKANPDTTIQVGSKRLAVHARVADPDERKRLWPVVVKVYGGYEDYQRRTEREIPLVILEPKSK
jgi:deazaflavin-dependent oxidoreductase (nitroreductase family)